MGNPVTGTLATYLMPSAADLPTFETANTETLTDVNPLGAKGGGEGGIVPVGGVVANAVANALASLGVEPRDLPLSAPRIWELIQKGAKR